MTNIWLHVQIYKVNKSVRIKTKMLQNRFSHWPQFYFFKEILKFKLCWAPIHFYMFGFQFYYCHEPGHQIDADLGCGLSSHQQPQSLESAVVEAGAAAELSWLSSRHCLPWGGSPPVSPPSSSWPLGRFWYREEYFVKYSEEKYIYVFKRNITENEITLNSSIIIPFHCQIFSPVLINPATAFQPFGVNQKVRNIWD